MSPALLHAFDVFSKTAFIAAAVLWAGGVLWTMRGEWHKIRIGRPDGPAIGILVCMALFTVLVIGGRFFWGGGQVSMAAMFFLVMIMTALVRWGRNA
jgi:hypothetical protein